MLVTPQAVRERRLSVHSECSAQGLDQEQTARRLLEVDPDYPPALLALGMTRLEEGDFAAAEPFLWRAVEGAPSNPGYYIPLARLYHEQGESGLSELFVEMVTWKMSFYVEVPETLATAMTERVPELQEVARNPEVYRLLAERAATDPDRQPWPDRLLPYRLLNDVQRQAETGLAPELIDEIRAHASVCARLFYAALREAYDTELSTLSCHTEELLMALLGEIGGVELIDDLLDPPDGDADGMYHSQWAVRRLGQRFPGEGFARLKAAATHANADVKATIAQHFYFLREMPGARQAILELLDGFPSFSAEEGAPYLLLTVSTLMALMGAPGESLAVIKRHERQLSKDGRRWMADAIAADEPFTPDLIDFGIDEVDIYDVCALAPLDEEEGEDYYEEDEEEYEEEPAPVVKPGRNDPCWCGSGKKYKKCHLPVDEQEERQEAAEEAEDNLFGDAWRQLLDFSKKFHRRPDMDQASQLYFGRRIVDVDSQTVGESGFLLWYVLDFRTSVGARTVIEEFLRRPGPRLTDRAQALIESWREQRYGFWEVQRIEPRRGAEVRDVFGGESYFVDDVSTSREAHQWDCMISRLHRFENRWLFVGDGLLVPRPLLPRIREVVEAGARESGMTPAEFFRSRSHEWRRVVLESYEEQLKSLRLVNFEGDPIEFSSAEYDAIDADAAAAALQGLPMFEEHTDEDDGPDKRTFGWLAEAEGDGPRRSYGHIEIGGGRLRLECNSRRRLEAGRGLVEKLCGAAVRHREDTFKTIDEAKAAAASEPREESDRIDPAIEREIVLKYQAEHYATWVDEPLPALRGRTPRQAVRTKRGREQVEELLRDFENSEDRARKAGRPAFDFSSVRATLGL